MKSYGSYIIFFILLVLSFAFVIPGEPDYFIKISGNRPYAVAFDKSRRMYMVTAPSTGNGTLSIVTPEGKISVIATLEGNFIGPGIYIDKNSNGIFITVGDKLLKINPDGKTKIIADGFSRCIDVKADKNDNIYIADDLKSTIYKITLDGRKSIFYQSDTVGAFVLTSIVIDNTGKNLFAREGNRIIRLKTDSDDTSEKPDVIIDNAKMFYLCIDDNNNLYASTLNNVIKIDPEGKLQFLSQSSLKTSIGLAVGGKGFDTNSLYVAVADGIIKLPIAK